MLEEVEGELLMHALVDELVLNVVRANEMEAEEVSSTRRLRGMSMFTASSPQQARPILGNCTLERAGRNY